MTKPSIEWFQSDEWAREAVLYQVDPRLFGGRYMVNMATLASEQDGAADRVFLPEHSGTFHHITSSIDAIQALGINTLWVMPPFARGQLGAKGAGSPYAVRDYARLQPELGSDGDFRELIAAAHARYMKVIVDFVPNHAARDSVLIERHLPPEDAWFYYIRDDPQRLYHDGDWSDTVKLNYSAPPVREYIIDTMIDILRRYDLDGMRLDMAHLVRYGPGRDEVVGGGYPEFWREALPRVRAAIARPLLFLAEVYGSKEERTLLEHGFDAVYHKEVFDIQRRRLEYQGPDYNIQAALHEELARFPEPGRTLRFAENHDDARAVQVFGGFREARLVAALSYVLPNVAMVYMGQEYGSFVKPSITELHEPLDPPGVYSILGTIVPSKPIRAQTYRFFRTILGLRRQHAALRRGRFVQLLVESLANGVATGRADEFVVALVRFEPGSGEAFVVALNYDCTQTRWGRIDLAWQANSAALPFHELLDLCGIAESYSVYELLDKRDFGKRTAHEHLLLGLQPLECQVLWLRRDQ